MQDRQDNVSVNSQPETISTSGSTHCSGQLSNSTVKFKSASNESPTLHRSIQKTDIDESSINFHRAWELQEGSKEVKGYAQCDDELQTSRRARVAKYVAATAEVISFRLALILFTLTRYEILDYHFILFTIYFCAGPQPQQRR